ncbi:hypothetical protein [Pseudomonas sp.]|uniref:hypothetical protein n=1 Tax=Pseudomonas sp. TaxID=306 RepID=UPI003262F722
MSLFFTKFGLAANMIEASKAPFHVGEALLVCGQAAEVKKLTNRTVINFDKPYPNQPLAVIIWNSDTAVFEKKFGSLAGLEGGGVCAYGKIVDYKGGLQVVVKKDSYLRLMKN